MEHCNLAIVFGPTLLRPPGSEADSNSTFFVNMNAQNALVESILQQSNWIFDDVVE